MNFQILVLTSLLLLLAVAADNRALTDELAKFELAPFYLVWLGPGQPVEGILPLDEMGNANETAALLNVSY